MPMQKIAEYTAAQRTAQLDANVRHHTRRAVIDWYAALIAGAGLAPATLMRKAFAGEIGQGAAMLYPEGTPTSARVAAFINGAASHTAEFDDIYRDAIYHPGCPVIAAALATAQVTGADGERFMRAVVAGYEVSTRLGAAVAPAHYRYWHPTGTVGSFGAAAAASVVLGLDAQQTAHALATAGTFAAALQQAFRSDAMSKPLHAGRAAEAGVSSALMAREGVTGALDILEGEAGFGAAMADHPDWDKAFADLGERHNITQVTFKNHGCCGHIFSAIDATLAICREHGLKAADVEHVRIESYKVSLDVTGRTTATTPFEAKFCLRYGVATAILFGRVRSEAFQPERVVLPEVQALMRRVDLVEDPALTALFPGQRAARAIVTTRGGARYEYLQAHRHGDPEDPLTDEELADKFMELTEPAAGTQASRVLAQLQQLDTATSEEIARLGVLT
ncbi:MmgE/PrpD family protein [Ramlibacter albus]|uniref:MmgE/PrpD family protein n=1 Tax=Ramlibacter albus TaxID=2079448 RepID=A0A923MEL5_9BURK|nr:MmgE/PrpD family protein [Ramlibacter albus]MBC5767864.1 MmgE/PrpD family protein [Ramlibacter albus]